jgi:two-component system response regulator PhoP
MRILVVEDDSSLRASLVGALQDFGYVVDACHDGLEGLFYAQEYPIDLAIIDIGLPGISGIELVQKVREQRGKLPILMLTARSDWQDKVQALEAGADDYLTKPFQLEELLARVQALLRRAAGYASSEISLGPLVFNLSSQLVRRGNDVIELTALEYKLLEYFAMNPDRVLSKSQLSDHLYEEDADPDSNVIEVMVGRLRKKIDPGNDWQPIKTRRGQGYCFQIDNLEDGSGQ